MKRTRNGILIPDVPIMAGGNLPNAVKGVSAGGANWKQHAVDMGLPSGLLWADCDIDVNMPDKFCVTPFIYQKSFFSWGNVQGYNPIAESFENVYNWGGVNDAEPYYDGQPYGNTKGNTLTDNIPIDEEFDAARANLGAPWRMPLITEFQELIDNCIYIDADGVEVAAADKRVIVNGVTGLYLQSRINGSRLFFATTGYSRNTSWINHNTEGHYWSGNYDSARNARSLRFSDNGVFPQNTGDSRALGYAVRAVAKF